MLDMYRMRLNKYLDLEGVTDRELSVALEQIGRDLIYNYFVYGKNVTFEIFLENLSTYLNITKKFNSTEIK